MPSITIESMLLPDPSRWSGPRCRVTDLVRDGVTPEQTGRTEAYLCGSRAMVEDVTDLLRAKGMGAEQIHTENFY